MSVFAELGRSEFRKFGSVRVRFRLFEPFGFFDLPRPGSEGPFGLGGSAEGRTEKRLRFFGFPSRDQSVSVAHNPLVPGSSPGGPTNFHKIIALWR